MLFSTRLVHSNGSFAHVKASWDSFASVFCHVEFLWCRFHVIRFVHRVDAYVGFVFCCSKPYIRKLRTLRTFLSSFEAPSDVVRVDNKGKIVSSYQVIYQDGKRKRALTVLI